MILTGLDGKFWAKGCPTGGSVRRSTLQAIRSRASIVAPAGTPREVILRLNREIAKTLESQDIKAYYDTAGRTIVASSPDAFAAIIREEITKWREVVRKAGITPG